MFNNTRYVKLETNIKGKTMKQIMIENVNTRSACLLGVPERFRIRNNGAWLVVEFVNVNHVCVEGNIIEITQFEKNLDCVDRVHTISDELIYKAL